jgi:hypothetical protein
VQRIVAKLVNHVDAYPHPLAAKGARCAKGALGVHRLDLDAVARLEEHQLCLVVRGVAQAVCQNQPHLAHALGDGSLPLPQASLVHFAPFALTRGTSISRPRHDGLFANLCKSIKIILLRKWQQFQPRHYE